MKCRYFYQDKCFMMFLTCFLRKVVGHYTGLCSITKDPANPSDFTLQWNGKMEMTELKKITSNICPFLVKNSDQATLRFSNILEVSRLQAHLLDLLYSIYRGIHYTGLTVIKSTRWCWTNSRYTFKYIVQSDNLWTYRASIPRQLHIEYPV